MTEIAPGMMVECIDDSPGTITAIRLYKNKRYLITKFYNKVGCGKCGKCTRIQINNAGWCVTRFRPIGGDKEIERELFETNPPKKLKIYYCE